MFQCTFFLKINVLSVLICIKCTFFGITPTDGIPDEANNTLRALRLVQRCGKAGVNLLLTYKMLFSALLLYRHVKQEKSNLLIPPQWKTAPVKTQN